MSQVTTGTAPHRAHTWKSAVPVPNAYLDSSAGSRTAMSSWPAGHDVHAAPCRVQNEHVHARTAIVTGSGSQVSQYATFVQ